ncbi:MAG: hypothetical protein D3909_13215, partial [Candidatus Electrothrix sp. ATG1]|nr:hypothetical protein [Candidatus Electrothrix sp. ATG1]
RGNNRRVEIIVATDRYSDKVRLKFLALIDRTTGVARRCRKIIVLQKGERRSANFKFNLQVSYEIYKEVYFI